MRDVKREKMGEVSNKKRKTGRIQRKMQYWDK